MYTNRKPLYGLFLDMKKAFDSIDRKYIYRKIIDSKKFTVHELNLLADILDINFLQINDGITTSKKITQSNGVKQGGSLSLFCSFLPSTILTICL